MRRLQVMSAGICYLEPRANRAVGFMPKHYQAHPLERALALVVATGIIVLAAYLIIRNTPFADPNLVVITRIVLSLGVAVLGGTIPGFLNVGWNGGGFAIRAGGALALFIITFKLSPDVLPALTETAIPQLTHPRKIQSVPTALALFFPPAMAASATDAPEKGASISIRAVYQGDDVRQRKMYDIVISNSDDRQRLLASFNLTWLYMRGYTLSIDQGVSIKPVERYAVEIPIDPDKAEELFQKTVPVYPPLILPPKNVSGPSVTSIRLEVFYSFENARINWHPSSDWNIFYAIDLEDELGAVVHVLSQSWRRGDAPNWIEDFKRNKLGQ